MTFSKQPLVIQQVVVFIFLSLVIKIENFSNSLLFGCDHSIILFFQSSGRLFVKGAIGFLNDSAIAGTIGLKPGWVNIIIAHVIAWLHGLVLDGDRGRRLGYALHGNVSVGQPLVSGQGVADAAMVTARDHQLVY